MYLFVKPSNLSKVNRVTLHGTDLSVFVLILRNGYPNLHRAAGPQMKSPLRANMTNNFYPAE